MSVRSSTSRLRAEGLYDRIIAERHRRMMDGAARRLVNQLGTLDPRRAASAGSRPGHTRGLKPR